MEMTLSEHTYYPDFYIISKNEIVEVKSTYTIQRDVEKNKAKICGALKNGYNVMIMVFDGSKSLVRCDFIKTEKLSVL